MENEQKAVTAVVLCQVLLVSYSTVSVYFG